MRRSSIGLDTIFVLASLLVIALLTARFAVQHETPSNLLAASDALNPTNTRAADTSANTQGSATAYPTVDYGYDRTEDGPDLKSYLSPDGKPGVPVYPSAELGSENCSRSCPIACVSDYMASREEQAKVEAFYNEALPKRDWKFIRKSEPEDRLITQNYYYSWKNPSNSGPGRVFLTVAFERQSKGIYIGMQLSAWPDAKNPPLHPQAKEVQVQWTKDSEYGYPERTVSYIINLGKSEIVEYYKKTMKQQGWCFLTNSSDSELGYFYTPQGPEGRGGAKIEVTSAGVYSNNSKGIDTVSRRVLITTSSDDFTPEDAQEGR